MTTESSASLTQDDVAKLLAEPSAVVRAELAGKIALQIDNPQLNDNELSIAQDIVRYMSKDVEAQVRESLAHSVRHAVRLPHEVAMRLAKDIESVALPFLESTQVLNEEDLVEIIKSGAAAKQEVIAARTDVSEVVSEAIINTAGEKAVATLMENETAKISETGFTKAVDRFAESETVKEKIVMRPALPPAVTERLVTMVAENLKDYLVAHHELPATMATDLVLQGRERTVMNLASGSSEADLERLVTQMHKSNRLTPSLILRALCLGDILFFEMAMAVMANVPLVNARILIHDAGRLGLKSLYERTGMPSRLLPALRVAVDVINETAMDGGEHDRERYRARVIERILTQYQDIGNEDIDYLLYKLDDVLHAA